MIINIFFFHKIAFDSHVNCLFVNHFMGKMRKIFQNVPASVTQSAARPTGDQEVAGSIPARSGNMLSWRLIMKYFLWSFSLFR